MRPRLQSVKAARLLAFSRARYRMGTEGPDGASGPESGYPVRADGKSDKVQDQWKCPEALHFHRYRMVPWVSGTHDARTPVDRRAKYAKANAFPEASRRVSVRVPRPFGRLLRISRGPLRLGAETASLGRMERLRAGCPIWPCSVWYTNSRASFVPFVSFRWRAAPVGWPLPCSAAFLSRIPETSRAIASDF